MGKSKVLGGTSLRSKFNYIWLRVAPLLRLSILGIVMLCFAALGVVDAGLRWLWPSWRAHEHTPRWVSKGLVRCVLWLYPLAVVVPYYSWRPQYRVLRVAYPSRLCPGEMAWVTLTYRNISGEVWQGGKNFPCQLGMIHPYKGSALYVKEAWLAPNRPAVLPPGSSIAPLEVAKFRVPIQAPKTPGRYREIWGVLIEGRNWLTTFRASKIQIEVREDR